MSYVVVSGMTMSSLNGYVQKLTVKEQLIEFTDFWAKKVPRRGRENQHGTYMAA
jgi:hypothetical protein